MAMYQSLFSDAFSKGEYQLLLPKREEGEMKGFVRESLEMLLGDIGEKVVEHPSSQGSVFFFFFFFFPFSSFLPLFPPFSTSLSFPLFLAIHIPSSLHVIDWVTPQESIYTNNPWSIC